MADSCQSRDGKNVYSADLLSRIPQKLYLSEREYPALLPVAIAVLTVATGAMWCAISSNAGWGPMAGIIGCGAALLAGYAFWLVLSWFVIPVLKAKGFYPLIEYLPEENKVVIFDRPGRSVWGEENAVMTVFLNSMTGVMLQQEGNCWITAIRLRKGDLLIIRSSARKQHSDALKLATDLAAMLSLPLCDEKSANDTTGNVQNVHI